MARDFFELLRAGKKRDRFDSGQWRGTGHRGSVDY